MSIKNERLAAGVPLEPCVAYEIPSFVPGSTRWDSGL